MHPLDNKLRLAFIIVRQYHGLEEAQKALINYVNVFCKSRREKIVELLNEFSLE